jgi:hypothetical protein
MTPEYKCAEPPKPVGGHIPTTTLQGLKCLKTSSLN